MFEMFPQAPVVSISTSQRIPLPSANWLITVYHGLPEGYLAFLGRIGAAGRSRRAARGHSFVVDREPGDPCQGAHRLVGKPLVPDGDRMRLI
jgi:hypothetical protein